MKKVRSSQAPISINSCIELGKTQGFIALMDFRRSIPLFLKFSKVNIPKTHILKKELDQHLRNDLLYPGLFSS